MVPGWFEGFASVPSEWLFPKSSNTAFFSSNRESESEAAPADSKPGLHKLQAVGECAVPKRCCWTADLKAVPNVASSP